MPPDPPCWACGVSGTLAVYQMTVALRDEGVNHINHVDRASVDDVYWAVYW